jgi:hypothetical protein
MSLLAAADIVLVAADIVLVAADIASAVVVGQGKLDLELVAVRTL